MICKNMTSAGRKSTRTPRRARSNLRARITAAFSEMANGVDARTACDRTLDFYRSSGAHWTRNFQLIRDPRANDA
jgi:hypothetical protein